MYMLDGVIIADCNYSGSCAVSFTVMRCFLQMMNARTTITITATQNKLRHIAASSAALLASSALVSENILHIILHIGFGIWGTHFHMDSSPFFRLFYGLRTVTMLPP